MRRTLVLLAIAVVVTAAELAMGWPPLAAVMMGVALAGAVQAVLVIRRDARATFGAVPAAFPARRDAIARLARLFPLFAAWIAANLLLTGDVMNAVFGPSATSAYSPALVLVLVVLLPVLVAGAALVRGRRSSRVPALLRRLALPGALLLLLAVKVAVVYGVTKVPAFDAGNVFLAAYGKAVPGELDYWYHPEFYDYYFGILPNNLFLAWAQEQVLHLGWLLGLRALFSFVLLGMLVNCVVLTVSELLTFLVVRRVWGARAAWIALAVLAVFTTLSPWLNTPYSDTFGMLFPILTVYLWLRVRGTRGLRRRLALGALLGVVVAVGIEVKPTTVFALVAILAVELFRLRRVLLRRRTVLVGTAAIAGIGLLTGGGTALLSTAAIDASGFTTYSTWTDKNALPLTHFLKMGAQGTGGYNGADVISTEAVPVAHRSNAALAAYFQRVAAMGIEGYPLFLERKALSTFSDGSFAQGKEGDPFPNYLRSDPWSEGVRQWFLLGGANHWYLSSLWQAVWILLLVATALPVSRFADPRRRRMIDVGRLSMLLLLLFLLFFETRARYVYLYVPVVVALGVGSVSAVPAAVAALRAGFAYRLDRIRPPRPALPRLPRLGRRTARVVPLPPTAAPAPVPVQGQREPEPVR